MSHRGRKRNEALPHTKSLENQRAFRARRAAYVKGLEQELQFYRAISRGIEEDKVRVGCIVERLRQGVKVEGEEFEWLRRWSGQGRTEGAGGTEKGHQESRGGVEWDRPTGGRGSQGMTLGTYPSSHSPSVASESSAVMLRDSFQTPMNETSKISIASLCCGIPVNDPDGIRFCTELYRAQPDKTELSERLEHHPAMLQAQQGSQARHAVAGPSGPTADCCSGFFDCHSDLVTDPAPYKEINSRYMHISKAWSLVREAIVMATLPKEVQSQGSLVQREKQGAEVDPKTIAIRLAPSSKFSEGDGCMVQDLAVANVLVKLSLPQTGVTG